jgi:hypothetical protein
MLHTLEKSDTYEPFLYHDGTSGTPSLNYIRWLRRRLMLPIFYSWLYTSTFLVWYHHAGYQTCPIYLDAHRSKDSFFYNQYHIYS